MKLLLDNNLSPQVVALLAVQGHEAEHVRDHGMQAAPDEAVLELAAERPLARPLRGMSRTCRSACWSQGVDIDGDGGVSCKGGDVSGVGGEDLDNVAAWQAFGADHDAGVNE